MKKNKLFLLFTLSLVSCNDSAVTPTPFEQFKDDFQTKYPNGYILKNGWYSAVATNNLYKNDSLTETTYEKFVGNLSFDNTINVAGNTDEYYFYSERKNTAQLIMEHTYFSSSNYFKSSREELFVDVSRSAVPPDYYMKYSSTGGSNITFPNFIFQIDTYYNELNIFDTDVVTYCNFQNNILECDIHLFGSELSNVLLTTRYYYYFDTDLNITKIVEEWSKTYTGMNEVQNYYIILTQCEAQEIKVPTEYDIEYDQDSIDTIKI